jgi:hypothetical protein
MCCITWMAPVITMATTQLMREARCETRWVSTATLYGHDAPRMNWVVVTDENQNRRMRMRWTPSAEDR